MFIEFQSDVTNNERFSCLELYALSYSGFRCTWRVTRIRGLSFLAPPPLYNPFMAGLGFDVSLKNFFHFIDYGQSFGQGHGFIVQTIFVSIEPSAAFHSGFIATPQHAGY
jgi:hypothetical protein